MDNITVYCSQCGNPIACEAGREFVFCTRCGHKIILTPPQPVEQEVTEPQQPEPEVTEPQPDSVPEKTVSDEPAPAEEQPEAAENAEYRPEPPAEYQPEPPAAPENVEYQPVPPVQPVPAPVPVPAAPVMPMPRPVYQQPVAVEADLSLAISCYNRGDYDTADKCLAMLFDTESENSGVWFCACKVLAAKKPENPGQALVKYVNFAAECLRLSGDNPEARGQLTIEFNHMLKNTVDAVVNGRMYFEPYDGNIMSESVPTMRYQPLQKSDAFYQSFYSCVCEFRNSRFLLHCPCPEQAARRRHERHQDVLLVQVGAERANSRKQCLPRSVRLYLRLQKYIRDDVQPRSVQGRAHDACQPHYLSRQVAVEAQVHGYARDLRPPHSGSAAARRDRAGNARLQNHAFTFITYDMPQS